MQTLIIMTVKLEKRRQKEKGKVGGCTISILGCDIVYQTASTFKAKVK